MEIVKKQKQGVEHPGIVKAILEAQKSLNDAEI